VATQPTQQPNTLPQSAISNDDLRQAVSLAYFRKGQSIEPRTLDMVCTDLRQIINQQFRSLTPYDIKKAIGDGVLGKYGEVYSVSVCAIVDWLNAYITDPDRIAAQNNAKKAAAVAALPQKATVTEAEDNEQRRKLIYMSYQSWLKKGEFLDFHGMSYDYLIAIKAIKPTDEEKNRLFAYHFKSECSRVAARSRKGIVTIGVADTDIAKLHAVIKSKTALVIKFFEKVKESGKDIRDYV